MSKKKKKAEKQKGISTAVLQPLLTLKSNTMKNTMQRYGLSGNLQIPKDKKAVL